MENNGNNNTQKRPKNRAVYGFRKDYPGSTGSSDYLIGESRNRRTRAKIRKGIFVVLLVAVFCVSFVATSTGIMLSKKPVSEEKNTSTVNEQAVAAQTLGKTKALYFNKDVFATADTVNALIEQAKKAGANTVVIDFKNSDGDLCYKSELLTAQDIFASSGGFDLVKENIALIKSNKIKVIAAVSCFEDTKAANGIAEAAIHTDGGTDVWKDSSNSSAWLNPYSPSAVSYLKSIIGEINGMGVDGFLLNSVCFPSGENSDSAAFPNEKTLADRNAVIKSFINSVVYIAAEKPVIVSVTFDAAFSDDADAYGGSILDSAAKYYMPDLRAFSQKGNIIFGKKLFKDNGFASYDFVLAFITELNVKAKEKNCIFVPLTDNTSYSSKALSDSGCDAYILG